MGKTILKLLNFDINMTKFGSSLQVIPLPSLPLPLCQYISKLICTMYLPTVQHLSMVYSTVGTVQSQCFYPQYLHIYFSLYLPVNSVHISSVFICLQIFLIVYLIYSKYSIYFSTVFFLSILQRLSICYVKLSSVPFYLKMPFYLFYCASYCV